jgi:hypothetical protein
MTRATVHTAAADDRRGRKHRNRITLDNMTHVPAGFDDASRKLVTENHRRVIFETVFINVQVGTANTAIANLDLYLIVSTARLFDVAQFDVADSRFIFDQRFDCRYLQILLVPDS